MTPEEKQLNDILTNVYDLCNLIVNSPSDTTIKGEIESQAHWIAHCMMQLPQYSEIMKAAQLDFLANQAQDLNLGY